MESEQDSEMTKLYYQGEGLNDRKKNSKRTLKGIHKK